MLNIMQNIIMPMCDLCLKIENFNILFILLSVQDSVYCTLTGNLHSDAKYSFEMLDLYLHFTKFTRDKVDSHI